MERAYHSGELEVQAKAGVRDQACRVARSIHSFIPPAAQAFLRSQRMVIIGSLDSSSRMWASALTGEPGFIHTVDEQTVQIDAWPVSGDPLRENLSARDDVGLLVIDFATRQRMRVNGKAMVQTAGSIRVRAEQVYSNCPKYIQRREWQASTQESHVERRIEQGETLTTTQQRWISRADTFFIASFYQRGGADVSHRGGGEGFVRVIHGSLLAWPDYSGNMMFQTLGNVFANPNAGLLFIDFECGNTLQLNGKARVIWDEPRMDGMAEDKRMVEFRIEQVIEIEEAIRPRWRFVEPSPDNPNPS